MASVGVYKRHLMDSFSERHKGRHGLDCLCAYCGKPLCKNGKELEQHHYGIKHGYCFCKNCFGKEGKDRPEIDYKDIKDDPMIAWKGRKIADELPH